MVSSDPDLPAGVMAGLVGDLQDLVSIYQGFLEQILDAKNPVVHDVDPPVPSPLLPAQAPVWDNCGGGVLRDDDNGGMRRTGFSCDGLPADAGPSGREAREAVTVVYRVQTDHPNSQRLVVGADGNVSHQGDGALYLNMSGDIGHSQDFRGGDGSIVAFDVPTSVVNDIRESALPQRMPRGFAGTRRDWNIMRKNAPEIADPRVSPGLIGLPASMIDEFMARIVPGSGRIVG